MCRPASFVVTKDHVYWSVRGDSHADIINEHRLHPDGVYGPNIVGAEIVPPNYDYSLPIEQWQFAIDEGYNVCLPGYIEMLPKWWDAEDVERRCRAVLPEWYAAHVITGPNGTCRGDETRIVLSGGVVVVTGGVCYTCDGSTATVHNGDCNARAGSTVTMYGGGCFACDGSTIEVYGGVCYAKAGSIVTMHGGGCEARAGSTITVYGGLCHANRGSTVTMHGGNCTIYGGSSVVDGRKERNDV